MVRINGQKISKIEKLALSLTNWIGTPQSLLVHSLFFIGIPSLGLFGFEFRTILLAFTTWLSIEAIYLAIFIQMTVNRTSESLEEVEEDIEDIQEDIVQIQAEEIDEEDAEKALHNPSKYLSG
ncbi:DUF1003 domain-containing protein [Candidatus Daviesbacteria bacterium]|nr:DUF1003 domain-containing protein [Candidatus Daviesbacteria bacterium]